MLILLFLLVGLALGQMPETLQFNKTLVEALDSTALFDNLALELTDTPGTVHYISAAFYDTHLVSRFTNEWLGGNTTWILGVTRPDRTCAVS